MRKIYFGFDIEADTALSVATEMVGELDITEHDVTMIAEMIDSEMLALVPEWRPGVGITEEASSFCHECADTCCGCSAMHGRFEEITYSVRHRRRPSAKFGEIGKHLVDFGEDGKRSVEGMLESLRMEERQPPSKSFARCEAGKNSGLHRTKSLSIDAVDA